MAFATATRKADVAYSGNEVKITAQSSRKHLGATLTVNHNKARWVYQPARPDQSEEPFIIPRGYRHIKASALVRALGES